MSWRAGAATVLLTFARVDPALACDCPLPKDLKTHDERLAYRLGKAPVAASLRINGLQLRTSERSDPRAIGDAVVVKQIKGQIAGRLRIETWGGEEGANCGLASALFEAASNRKLLDVALYEVPGKPRTFWITNCGYYQLGEFGSANAN